MTVSYVLNLCHLRNVSHLQTHNLEKQSYKKATAQRFQR